MKRLRRSRRGNEAGAALIEASLVIPIVLLLIMGVVDIGRLLTTSAKIQESAQEGALFASYAPDDYLDVRDRVLDSLDDFNIAVGAISITCGGDETITVAITHDVDLITPWIGGLLGSTVTVSGEATGQNFTDKACDPTP